MAIGTAIERGSLICVYDQHGDYAVPEGQKGQAPRQPVAMRGGGCGGNWSLSCWDVDIYVVLKMPLSNELKIAVDAKDYIKPLTRDQAAAEIVSYSPLLQNHCVDQFMLVTRNGIATKAKLAFDGRTKQCTTRLKSFKTFWSIHRP